MKHDALIAPDESQFAFSTQKMSGLTVQSAGEGQTDAVTVPDAHLLFSGDFKRAGNDLKITGDDGKSFLVSDYFKNDKHPALRSPEGAILDSHLVDLLAGPLAPGQYAQAGTPQPGANEAVGRIAVVTGNVTVIRNGVAITVNAGDVVLKNDVVQTGAGSTVGLALNDGSTFNLSANARLAINEFVYDPNGSANSSLTTLIQGAATFVAGQVAKTGDMKVSTPIATMGIRGTAVILDINAADGRVSISVVDERDNKEHNVEVYDRAGNLIATATSVGGRLFLTPTATLEVIASFTNKTPDMVAAEFAAFQAVLSSYDAAKQFFPNLPDRADITPRNTQTAEGTTIQPSESGSKTIPDPATVGDPVVVREVVITRPADTTGTGTIPRDHAPDSGPNVLGPEVTLAHYTTLTGTSNADMFGPNEGPGFQTTEGDDLVLAGGGDDTIEAGDGNGNDIYDGGAGFDKLIYPSATEGVVFNLHGIAAPNNTADDATSAVHIGHDIFTNIERIEAGPGDDVFKLYANDEWSLDGQGGVDIIRFIGSFDILEGAGVEAENIEIIDLNQDSANAIRFDAQGVFEVNDDHTIRVLGGASDVVTLANDYYLGDEQVNGHWELVSECPALDPLYEGIYWDDVLFYEYQFVSGDSVLATVYLQQDILYNAPPDIEWMPGIAITPFNTPLYVDGMQFGDTTASEGELFTFTVKVFHGLVELAFDPADFDLTQVPIEGDGSSGNTLPYQLSFTGTLADINAALEACQGENGFIYTPESGYSGPSELRFTVTDSHGASDTRILNISVSEPVNQAPEITLTDQDPSPLVEAGTEPGFDSARITVSVNDPDSNVRYELGEGWEPFAPDNVEGLQEYNGHYYAFVSFAQGEVGWSLAQRNAQAMGGDLATITSAGENDFIFTNLVDDYLANGETTAYLGGSDANSPGLWYWGSGLEGIPYFWSNEAGDSSYGQYTNWRDGEPNNVNGFEHYVVMESNGQWNDGMSPYSLAVGYVVEFSNYRMDGTYGYAIFNTANGTITYHLDNNDPDTQALVADAEASDSFEIAVTDGNTTTTQTVNFEITGANDAPVAKSETLSGDLAGFTYNAANGHWYKINPNEVTWTDARSQALAAGGYLATITSDAENDFVSTLLTDYGIAHSIGAGNHYAYVGGTDQAVEGQWRWIDGPESGLQFWDGDTGGLAWNGAYENWQRVGDSPEDYHEPDGGEFQNIMYIRGTGEWVDFPDISEGFLYSVIEVSGFVEDTVSVIPSAFLLANDTDVDSPAPVLFWVGAIDGETHGTVELIDGNIHYTPDENYNGTVSFEYTVRDAGGAVSDTATATFTVAAVNDAPVIDLNGEDDGVDNAVTFEGPEIFFAANAAISDPDLNDTIVSAVITLTNPQNGEQEALEWTGQLPEGITGEFRNGDDRTQITFSGSASREAYEQVLALVRYGNSSNEPGESRSITIEISDGEETASATTTVTFEAPPPSNEAPVVDLVNHSGSYTEGGYFVLFAENITLSDSDSDTLVGATISIENYHSGDVIGFLSSNGLSFVEQDGVLTFTGTATVAEYRDVLSTMYFFHTGDNPTDDIRTISVQVDDGSMVNNLSNVSTFEVAVAPVNDAPAISFENAATSGDNPTTLSGLSISDVDGDGDTFTVNLSTQLSANLSLVNAHGVTDTDGSPNDISFQTSLATVNAILADGVTYDNSLQGPGEGSTEIVTLEIIDQQGANDTLHFVFNVFDPDPPVSTVTLTGTSGKDLVFATGYDDTLTGDPGSVHGADTFVFDHNVSGEGIGNDVITDFTAGQDKIALLNFGISSIDGLVSYDAQTQIATISLGQDESIVLQNVAQAPTNDSFIFS